MASKELLGTPDAPGAEVTIPGAETAEATVSGNVTVTEVEEADLTSKDPRKKRFSLSGIPAGVKVPRSVPQNWPRGINSETHQEWDDSDLGISGMFDAWGRPGCILHQRWSLLLVNAILFKSSAMVRGVVVETYRPKPQIRLFRGENGDWEEALSTVGSSTSLLQDHSLNALI
ncbi:hypothetical protein B0O80DRAFT_501550 [Mortierella sp. GBAus27b]|nr:hypothetical protein B0O80DRAFT_501550 [Mortierella sp. GBAus27b]